MPPLWFNFFLPLSSPHSLYSHPETSTILPKRKEIDAYQIIHLLCLLISLPPNLGCLYLPHPDPLNFSFCSLNTLDLGLHRCVINIPTITLWKKKNLPFSLKSYQLLIAPQLVVRFHTSLLFHAEFLSDSIFHVTYAHHLNSCDFNCLLFWLNEENSFYLWIILSFCQVSYDGNIKHTQAFYPLYHVLIKGLCANTLLQVVAFLMRNKRCIDMTLAMSLWIFVLICSLWE